VVDRCRVVATSIGTRDTPVADWAAGMRTPCNGRPVQAQHANARARTAALAKWLGRNITVRPPTHCFLADGRPTRHANVRFGSTTNVTGVPAQCPRFAPNRTLIGTTEKSPLARGQRHRPLPFARMRAQKQKAIVDPITRTIIVVFHKAIGRAGLCDREDGIYFKLTVSLAFLFPALRHLMPNSGHFQI
jgi:hypothetical protein